jgi:hypothetical protein
MAGEPLVRVDGMFALGRKRGREAMDLNGKWVLECTWGFEGHCSRFHMSIVRVGDVTYRNLFH